MNLPPIALASLASLALLAFALSAVSSSPPAQNPAAAQDPAAASQDPAAAQLSTESTFLANIRQLTFEGKRAGEGYFSADGSKMIFQSEREPDNPFYQIYLLDFATGDVSRVSPGTGKTTCAWIHPSGEKVLFASTHLDPDSPKLQQGEFEERKSPAARRYSWDYDAFYDIFEAKPDGTGLKNLTATKGYDAEGAYSPDGSSIVFASNRHAYTGELDPETRARFEQKPSYLMDIYTMDADGGNVRRLTDTPGYDGGPFFSADGKKICWRRFNESGEQAEIYTMDADGSGQRQITKLGAMSWAPYFHPSGEYLIFATNLQGFANFELYLVDAAGEADPVRVTDTDGFDGLPTFSPDGKKLSWTSNRTSDKQSQIFIADWDHNAARKALKLGLATAQKPGPNGPVPAADPTFTRPDLTATKAEIRPEDIRLHIDYLASEALGGRFTGSPGHDEATAYVADIFKSYGLEPGGDDGSFFQEFEFTAGVDLGDGNKLAATLAGESSEPKIGADWLPLSFSETGKIEPAEIVFAGYGMEVPEDEKTGDNGDKPAEAYSSYFHLDVKDKWVLVLRYLPDGVDQNTRTRFSRHASLRYKALEARKRGARGILVVSGPNAKVRSQLVPLSFDASMAGSGIAAISVSDAFGDRLLAASGQSLKDLQTKLDTGEMLAGFTLKDASLGGHIDIRQERKTGRNVIAVLPANSPAKDPALPAILVGAHIDHLGVRGGNSSRAEDDQKSNIHFGADDNASGVAGILEIAQLLSAQRDAGKLDTKRAAIFAAWSGEEIGLLGSGHYVRQIAIAEGGEDKPIRSRIAAALNMDMIGRLRKSLVLQGVASSTAWKSEIERRNAVVGLPLTLQNDVYVPTDATSFYSRGVPILSAFTGAHEDYHTPADTPDKINHKGTSDIAHFMGLVMRGLLTSADSPDYVEVARPENQGARAMRVYLGTVPDYSQGDVEGVKLSGVSKVGPAGKAGVLGGDIIVSLGGQPIKNIYDYTYVLGALKVGQETTIEVKRGQETKQFKITPGSRD